MVEDVVETKVISYDSKMRVSVLNSISLQEFPLVPIHFQTRLPQVRERLFKNVSFKSIDKQLEDLITTHQKLLFLCKSALKTGVFPNRNFVYVDPALIDEETRIHKLFANPELCNDNGIEEDKRKAWKDEAIKYVMKKNEENEKELDLSMTKKRICRKQEKRRKRKSHRQKECINQKENFNQEKDSEKKKKRGRSRRNGRR